jgi:hypothetical protein
MAAQRQDFLGRGAPNTPVEVVDPKIQRRRISRTKIQMSQSPPVSTERITSSKNDPHPYESFRAITNSSKPQLIVSKAYALSATPRSMRENVVSVEHSAVVLEAPFHRQIEPNIR